MFWELFVFFLFFSQASGKHWWEGSFFLHHLTINLILSWNVGYSSSSLFLLPNQVSRTTVKRPQCLHQKEREITISSCSLHEPLLLYFLSLSLQCESKGAYVKMMIINVVVVVIPMTNGDMTQKEEERVVMGSAPTDDDDQTIVTGYWPVNLLPLFFQSNCHLWLGTSTVSDESFCRRFGGGGATQQ